MSKPIPVLESEFYHEGRGPELQRVVWSYKGRILRGFEYFNPDDIYSEENLRHLELEKVEAYSMAGEEVYDGIAANGDSRAAIFLIPDSPWKKSFRQRHLQDCEHFQIMFYDEIFDVICRKIIPGGGPLNENKAQQAAAPNRSEVPNLNSTSSARGSEG
jgi:hypothetical protein